MQDTAKKMKSKLQTGENIQYIHMFDKGFVPRTYEQHLHLNNKNTCN